MKKIIFFIAIIILPFISFAHSGDTIFVEHGISPVIDGTISAGEWDDAAIYTYQAGLTGQEITVTFYIKHNGSDTLYIAQNMPNTLSGDRDLVWFDIQNNGGASPQTDDYMLNKYHMDGSPTIEEKGTGSSWDIVTQNGWIVELTGDDWSSNVGQIEFAVAFSKLGITPNIQKTIGFGIAFGELTIPYNPSRIWSWPTNSDYLNPNSWADLLFFDTQTNIKEQKEIHSIMIFPNPTTGIFTIQNLKVSEKPLSVKITNISGQIIKQFTTNNRQMSIDLSEQTKGIYFIKILYTDRSRSKTDNQIYTNKLIVK